MPDIVDDPVGTPSKAYRFPIYNPQENPYVRDPYVSLLSQTDVEGDSSPYVIACADNRLTMKINVLAGGSCQWLSIDGEGSIGNWGFDKGVANIDLRIANVLGYQPNTAGFSADCGVETQITEIASGPGKGLLARKFKVPLHSSRQTGNFSRNADLVPLKKWARIDDEAYPEVKYLEQHHLVEGGMAAGDLVDEDVEGWTQVDEITSELSGSWHWANWERQAGIPAIRGRCYIAYERNPGAIRQFTQDKERASPKISTSVRGKSATNDLTGIRIGTGLRLLERLYPRDTVDSGDELEFTHYGTDETKVNGDVQLRRTPDFEETKVRHYSWSELMQDTVARDVTGRPYYSSRNKDLENPDFVANGGGGAESIMLSIVAQSNDADEDGAIGFYTPRSAINRLPIEGWNRVTGKLVYRDNRQIEKTARIIRSGNTERQGTTQYHQTIISGLFHPRNKGEWDDIVEVLHQDIIYLRGTPNEIREACHRMEANFRLEEDMVIPGDVPPDIDTGPIEETEPVARLPAYNPLEAPYVNDPYLIPQLTDMDDPDTEDDAGVQAAASPYFIQVGPPTKRLKMVFNAEGGGTCHYAEINGVSCANFGFGAGFFNSAVRDEGHGGWWNPTCGGWSRYSGPPTVMTLSGDGKTLTSQKFIVAFFENQEFMFSRNNDLAPHDYPAAQDYLDPYSSPSDHWSIKKYIDIGQNRDSGDFPAYHGGDAIDEDAMVPPWTQADEVQSEMCMQMVARDYTAQAGVPAIRIQWLWAFERDPKGMHQFEVDPDEKCVQISGTLRLDDPIVDDDLHGFAFNGGCRFNDLDDGTLSYLFFSQSTLDADGDSVLVPMVDYGGTDPDRTFYYAWMEYQDPAYGDIAYGAGGRRLHPQFDEDFIPNGTGGANSLYLNTMVPGTAVTAVTKGTTTIVTSSGWMPADGDKIYFAIGLDETPGMTEIVGPCYRATNISGATFEIRNFDNTGVNSTTWTDYTTGLIFGSPNDIRALAVYHPRSPAARYPIEGWARSGHADAGELLYRDNRRLQTSNKCTAKGSEERHGGQTYSTGRFSGLFSPRLTGPYANIVEVLYGDRILMRGSANEIYDAAAVMDAEFQLEVDSVTPVGLS